MKKSNCTIRVAKTKAQISFAVSENKGADQLRSYCEADLRLCFRIGKNPVFSRCGSNKTSRNLEVHDSQTTAAKLDVIQRKKIQKCANGHRCKTLDCTAYDQI